MRHEQGQSSAEALTDSMKTPASFGSCWSRCLLILTGLLKRRWPKGYIQGLWTRGFVKGPRSSRVTEFRNDATAFAGGPSDASHKLHS